MDSIQRFSQTILSSYYKCSTRSHWNSWKCCSGKPRILHMQSYLLRYIHCNGFLFEFAWGHFIQCIIRAIQACAHSDLHVDHIQITKCEVPVHVNCALHPPIKQHLFLTSSTNQGLAHSISTEAQITLNKCHWCHSHNRHGVSMTFSVVQVTFYFQPLSQLALHWVYATFDSVKSMPPITSKTSNYSETLSQRH